jgi:pyruvate ferredoxin oxidoreductase beta subunit
MDRRQQMSENPEPRDDQLFTPGHTMCPGCGVAISVKHIMEILGEETVALFTPGCLSAASSIEDNFRMRVPAAHMALTHAGSFSAGVSAGLQRQDLGDVTVAPLAGDGASGDIGLQALSAAAERNDDVLYFCLDNEAYANTGMQGSATTPKGASTETTPSGVNAPYGKSQEKKDLFKIITDHKVPYAATATPGYLGDLKDKVKKAKEMDGFRFIQVFDPCTEGWKYPAEKTVEISKLAVDTGMFPLVESEHGDIRMTKPIANREPFEEYLELQNRFEHLSDDEIDQLQASVDDVWNDYQEVSQ